MLRRSVVLAFVAAIPLAAGVTAIRIVDRADVSSGEAMGAAGPYERIVAKVQFAVDPALPANRIISDIDLAPRNEKGLVEFSADLYVMKPRDPGKGNGTILFEVSNRGGRGLFGSFGWSDAKKPDRAGDRFLMEQGYTLVWLGWQWDVPQNPERLRLYAPVATENGKPITGLVRAEFIFDQPGAIAELADRDHIAYKVLNPSDRSIQMTVRDRVDAPRKVVPRERWRFPDPQHVEMPGGFELGKLYEVVYRAQDPVLVGLGPTAVRDLISFLKYGGVETLLGDQRRYLKRAIGFGVSQSGRFLRTFLYYGFNQDEKDRRVFDGVWAHVAGGGRGSFNHRFAQASRDHCPHRNTLYPTDIFPFSDTVQSDPETGLTDGLLARVKDAPKIFYTNSSYEYWGRAASLVHTSIDGKRDVEPGPTTRVYLIAGAQHGTGSFPPVVQGGARYPRNTNDFRPLMRALLAAMNRWVTDGTEPPASRYPRIDRGELVPFQTVRFPKIAGVQYPVRMLRVWRLDFGPEFRSKGIVTYEPPRVGNPFAMLVPQVGAGGNETAGVLLPQVAVPLGVYTGWNLRTAAIGAPDELFNLAGSFFAFTREQAARYKGEEDYVARCETVARQLVSERLLLERDLPVIAEQARERWRYIQAAK